MNRPLKATIAAGTLALVLAGCSTHATAVTHATPVVHAIAHPVFHEPITVAAVGDSLSAWNGQTPIPHPWTTDLRSGPVIVDYSEGFAHGGYTLAQMAANLAPTTADYLVVMGGTNDVGPKTLNARSRWGTSMATMITGLETVVAEAGTPSDHVVIMAIPPMAAEESAVVAWNNELQVLATTHGWTLFNPWPALLGTNGFYQPNLTLDGIHPNDVGSAIVASQVAGEIEQLENATS